MNESRCACHRLAIALISPVCFSIVEFMARLSWCALLLLISCFRARNSWFNGREAAALRAYKRLDTPGEVHSDYSCYKWFGRFMIFKNIKSYWSFWQFAAGFWRVVIRELLSSNGFSNLWSLLWSFGRGLRKRRSYDVWILQNRTGLLLWTVQCLNQTCWWRGEATCFYTNVWIFIYLYDDINNFLK